MTVTATVRPVEEKACLSQVSRAGVEEPGFWNLLSPLFLTPTLGIQPILQGQSHVSKEDSEGLSWKTVGGLWECSGACPGKRGENSQGFHF